MVTGGRQGYCVMAYARWKASVSIPRYRLHTTAGMSMITRNAPVSTRANSCFGTKLCRSTSPCNRIVQQLVQYIYVLAWDSNNGVDWISSNPLASLRGAIDLSFCTFLPHTLIISPQGTPRYVLAGFSEAGTAPVSRCRHSTPASLDTQLKDLFLNRHIARRTLHEWRWPSSFGSAPTGTYLCN